MSARENTRRRPAFYTRSSKGSLEHVTLSFAENRVPMGSAATPADSIDRGQRFHIIVDSPRDSAATAADSSQVSTMRF
jgi:hypothetical protein